MLHSKRLKQDRGICIYKREMKTHHGLLKHYQIKMTDKYEK